MADEKFATIVVKKLGDIWLLVTSNTEDELHDSVDEAEGDDIDAQEDAQEKIYDEEDRINRC